MMRAGRWQSIKVLFAVREIVGKTAGSGVSWKAEVEWDGGNFKFLIWGWSGILINIFVLIVLWAIKHLERIN